MAKALVKSPGRKAASRTTGTRARAKLKTKSTKASSRAQAQPPKAQPKKAQPKQAQPKQAQPKQAQPKQAQPKQAQPKQAQPKQAQPKQAPKGKASPKGKATAPAKPAKASKAIESEPPKKATATKTSPPKQAHGAKLTAPAVAAKSGDPRGHLKERFAKLSQAKSQISGLKRSINKSFFDVGVILNQIRDERLYEVKGYGSFESFVEREIDLNKAVCLRSARIAVAITRDEAEAAGLERASAAVAALDGEEPQTAGFRPAGSPAGIIPVHKR